MDTQLHYMLYAGVRSLCINLMAKLWCIYNLLVVDISDLPEIRS